MLIYNYFFGFRILQNYAKRFVSHITRISDSSQRDNAPVIIPAAWRSHRETQMFARDSYKISGEHTPRMMPTCLLYVVFIFFNL